MKARQILFIAIAALTTFSCNKGNGGAETNTDTISDNYDIIRNSDSENAKIRKNFASFKDNIAFDLYFADMGLLSSRELSDMTKGWARKLRSFIAKGQEADFRAEVRGLALSLSLTNNISWPANEKFDPVFFADSIRKPLSEALSLWHVDSNASGGKILSYEQPFMKGPWWYRVCIDLRKHDGNLLFIVYDTVPTDQGLCFLDPELWFFDQNGETTTSLKSQEPVIYSTAERCHIVTFPVATLLPHLLNSENASLALKCTSNLAHDRKHPVIQILYVPLTEEGFPRRLLEDYKTCYNGNFSSLNEFFFKWPSCNK